MRISVVLRLVILLAATSVATVALAQNAPYQLIHEGKHWTWIARQDQFREHKADIEAMYPYADKAFDTLCEAWGFKPHHERYALLVMDHPGGGFATGSVGEARALRTSSASSFSSPSTKSLRPLSSVWLERLTTQPFRHTS